MGIHVFACLFWLVRVITTEEEEVSEFITCHVGLDVDATKAQGMVQIYMCCFYFVATVWTTVGFGDISGTMQHLLQLSPDFRFQGGDVFTGGALKCS
jgi:hypothetical protein